MKVEKATRMVRCYPKWEKGSEDSRTVKNIEYRYSVAILTVL